MTSLKGTLTALITTFDADGSPHEEAFRAHVQTQLCLLYTSDAADE